MMLASASVGSGKPLNAVETLERIVAEDPDLPEANLQLVNLLRQLGDPGRALQVGLRFLERNAANARMNLVVGVCHAEMLDFEKAESCFRRAVELEPGDPRHLVHLAKAQRILGARQEAIKTLEAALRMDPHSPGLLLTLGETLAEMGRFDEAIAAFEQAIEAQPRSGTAYLAKALARRMGERDATFVDTVRRLLREDLDPRERRALHYALGKALDDLGDHEGALAQTDEAVRLSGPSRAAPPEPDRAFDRRYFDESQGLGLDSELPVLIVGAPRSGTTLLDQILTSHPQVGGAGELLYWMRHAQEATSAIRSAGGDPARFARAYLELLERCAPDAARVTDKMPMNYLALGPIHTLLPKARIIHCQRHPIDTCLSLYLNGHSISPKPYGETREEIVAGYRTYLRAMEHWRRTLPKEVFLEVRYEDLVRDREPVVRRMIEFLGLPWDAACLQHDANPRDVATPSRWQARQPVYAGSVERWRRYEPWLGPFRELLDEGPQAIG
jgi:tetratricopeptide (TPR) repeat protein